jgi:hypothetical protein
VKYENKKTKKPKENQPDWSYLAQELPSETCCATKDMQEEKDEEAEEEEEEEEDEDVSNYWMTLWNLKQEAIDFILWSCLWKEALDLSQDNVMNA